MDPLSLAKVLWKHRWWALPAVIIVVLMAGYVLFFGPRVYESSATYVVVNPDTPSDREMERNGRLAKLNSDNPYLRASEPGLVVKVLVAKMSAQSTQLDMAAAGLSTEYTVTQSAQSLMTVVISAFDNTPEGAVASRQWLLTNLDQQLYDLQKVNDADDRYLFAALPVDVTKEPVEKVSSRLRSLIVTLGAGAILVMGVVSVAAALDRRRRVVPHPLAGASNELATPTGQESPPVARRNRAMPSAEGPWPQPVWLVPDANAVPLASTGGEQAEDSVERGKQYRRRPKAAADEPAVRWDA